MTRAAAFLALLALALCACGRDGDRQTIREVAVGFYAAANEHEGARACALLSSETRKKLEEQESESCDKAIDKVDLAGGPVSKVSVYSTEGAVELRGGDTVFVEDTKDGWRVAAAGCRPTAHAEPADCDLEG
jgi:hypothetical protein